MPGRKPKPAEVKRLEGNRGKRPLPKPMKLSRTKPAMPRGLTKAAQAEWKRIIREAQAVGLLTSLDHTVFRQYIYAWSAIEELEEQCRKEGRWITETRLNNEGVEVATSVKRAPWDTSLVQHRQRLQSLMSDIGLSPSARTRVAAAAEDREPNEVFTVFEGGKK